MAVLYKIPLISLFLLAATDSVRAALDKANEYKDNACQDGSYTHSGYLWQITMDDTSHSVYTATHEDSIYKWQAFSGKTGNGGSCNGEYLGDLGGPTEPCTDLDNYFPGERIRCIAICSSDDEDDRPCLATS